TECLIQPRQSLIVTVLPASLILGVNVSFVSNADLLTWYLTLDQNSSMGFKNGEYGGR
ncbi:hypothetical protein BD408DRAFT_353804, partial [Parasitella parasitica]